MVNIEIGIAKGASRSGCWGGQQAAALQIVSRAFNWPGLERIFHEARRPGRWIQRDRDK
jgi:hypothetical protein